MKVTILGPITQASDGTWQGPHHLVGALGSPLALTSIYTTYDPNSAEPIRISSLGRDELWAYRGVAIFVKGVAALTPGQVQMEVKHAAMRHDRRFERLRREIEAFENLDRADMARRERIPDSVRLFVWQRDQGKCVRCGGVERLEFDHVIPIAKGGSNTERNIQLLCEICNRSKGVSI